jgi:reactive intermediate/imine deaminase
VERSDVGAAGLHAQAVMVGGHRTVYVSGQVAADEEGNPIGNDVGAQAAAVFERIARFLDECGATLDDVVKITTFLVDMDDYQEFSEVRARYFPRRKPASSTVAVQALSRPEFLIEIEAVAAIR